MINIFIGKDITPAIINEVMDDSPALVSGLKKNDKIISIDKNKVKSILEVSTFINTSISNEIEFVVMRDNKEIQIFV